MRIRSVGRFQDSIRQAVSLIKKTPDQIVTFGIRPNYPAEIFGYIQRGRASTSDEEAPTFVVKRFREKPDHATATEYVNSGDFLWNSGIFI